MHPYPSGVERSYFKETVVSVFVLGCIFFNISYLPGQYESGRIIKVSDPGEESAGGQKNEEWISASGEYVTIRYKPGADLRSIERRLRRRIFFFGDSKTLEGMDEPRKVLYRLDFLFDRVQQILDMRPRGVHINVRIFSNDRELDAEYKANFGKGDNIKAFYIFAHNTIYTSEDDVSDSVMAHEMAHAIIDNYFNILPPEKVRELLAKYVDSQLDED